MGRRSLADERRPQIIAAAKRAIALHGLAGATQELISAEAGLSRPHIRHYVGNRDELIDQVWSATIDPYVAGIRAAVAALDTRGIGVVLDYLFGPDLDRDEDSAVIEAFFTEAQHDPRVRAMAYRSYRELEDALSQCVRTALAEPDPAKTDGIAYALLCLTIGASAVSGFPFPPSHRDGARAAAELLLSPPS
ncbi:MAG: TetR/AcrR family transcriptional regulator [Microbacterium sp.]|uniref:TetR/AcrR family transcriptional regulator n=1 Tax=Microbacterium sp. TaxID=51671 RepID=UPI003F822DAF